MQIDFQQGIITYPSSGNLQTFLAKNGSYVNLSTDGGRVDIAFAHKQSNYLLTESVSVTNAWGPIIPSTNTWLYWDINLLTGIRTFGTTLLAPIMGSSLPPSGAQDQHFFNTTTKTMYVFENTTWRNVVRTFAAKVNNTTFTTVGGGIPGYPFAGSQVGLDSVLTFVGRIVFDNVGLPIRRQDGTFFNTEDQFFVEGSPVNTIKLEANILTAIAQSPLAQFSVVKLTDFGKILYASYNDLQETFIAMLMEDLTTTQTGTMVSQGTITNPLWNWSTPGVALWVAEDGELTEIDPHSIDVITYPIAKSPVGRVITPTSIFFDQGLSKEVTQTVSGFTRLATNVLSGISTLSLAAENSLSPIVVGDNDPRLIDARHPLSHAHAAVDIVLSPYSQITASNVQDAIEQLEDAKVAKAGDTMTGALTLNADPVNALHAATKQYVDARVGSTILSDVSAALEANTINNGNFAQVWNWSKTTDSSSGFTFSENEPSINGTGNQHLLKISTIIDSTANPLAIYANGSTTETFLVDNIGNVTIHANDADGSSTTSGSTIQIFAGDATSKGGKIILNGGAFSGNGGNVVIRSGNNDDSEGIHGSIFLTIGDSTPSNLQIDQHGTWLLEGDAGIAGNVLTSNGIGFTPTWQSVENSGTPAGLTTQLQFNNSGNFGADSSLVWDNSLKHLIIGTGNLQIYGNAVGDIYNPNGDIRPHVAPGNSFRVFFGVPGSGIDRFSVSSTGAIAFNTSFGTTGQILISNGNSSPPTWEDASDGSGTPAGLTTQIQFNNSGSFGADSDFTWNSSTNQLYVAGSLGIGSTTLFSAATQVQVTDTGISGTEIAVTSPANSGLVLNAGTDGSGTAFIDFRTNNVLNANIAVNSATSGNPLELNSATTNNVYLVGGGGKVGININPPTELLHISAGNFRIQGTSGVYGIIFPDTSKLLSAGLLINTQSGTSYTLGISDAGICVEMTNGSANTLTVPPNSSIAFPIGTVVNVRQNGVGQTTIAGGIGVTINTPETLSIRKQWGTVTLHKRNTNEWCIEGNLEVAP